MRLAATALAAATTLALAAIAAPAASAITTAEPSTARATSSDAGAPFEKEAMDIRVKGRAAKAAGTTAITYRGGPVMTAATGTNAYVIWYGAWATGGKTVLTDFLSSIGGSPYFALNSTYSDKAGKKVANIVKLAGQTVDAGTAKTLSDANIKTIVTNAITSKRLPADANGVYFVLTAAGVAESSGFLTKYCGWHAHATISATDVKYAFVGDPTGASIASCSMQTATSPNAIPGVDAMISVVAHELEEAVTDPDLNAWYDSTGAENADKCAWTFGTTYAAAGGGIANMKLGTRDYLVQRNWKAGATQGCFLS